MKTTFDAAELYEGADKDPASLLTVQSRTQGEQTASLRLTYGETLMLLSICANSVAPIDPGEEAVFNKIRHHLSTVAYRPE